MPQIVDLRIKTSLMVHLRSGRKNLDLRTSTDTTERVRPGDSIAFRADGDARTCHRVVLAIRSYPSFEAMFKVEDIEQLWPDEDETALAARKQSQRSRGVKGVLIFELAPPNPRRSAA
jgi:ASC-1-like (ASCH) protein